MAGRKKGTLKTGGRKKGTPNKVTQSFRLKIARVVDAIDLDLLIKEINELSPKDKVSAYINLNKFLVSPPDTPFTKLSKEEKEFFMEQWKKDLEQENT